MPRKCGGYKVSLQEDNAQLAEAIMYTKLISYLKIIYTL